VQMAKLIYDDYLLGLGFSLPKSKYEIEYGNE